MTRVRRWPWLIVLLAALAWAAAIALAIPRVSQPLEWTDALWGLSFLGLSCTGAVVISRQVANRFGWFMLLGSVGVALGVLASDYANRVGEGMPWPAGAWVWHFGEVIFATAFALLVVCFYRFPDGTVPLGRVWQSLERIGVVLVAANAMTVLFDPTPGVVDATTSWPDPEVFWPSPLARYLPMAEMDAVSGIVLLATLAVGLGSFASLFARYRRGTATVRAQLRWVVLPVLLGLAVLVPTLILHALVEEPLPSLVEVAGTVVLTAGIPLGIFMAITKTGLYEIDRLVRRTVAYSIVTAMLVSVYAAAVLAIGQVATWLGATGNDVIVALSTLVAAALARPLFTTIRRTVDHRFHRAGRNAELTIAAFRRRLRHDISDESVRDGLVDAVNETLQPEFVGIWVPDPRSLATETS